MPLKFSQALKPVFISLSPNVERDDVWLALKLLLQPWRWKTSIKYQVSSIKYLEDEFKKYLGIKYAFAFNSGRTAFLAILESLGLEPGSEVLLQAFTCNAAVNPIIWSGLRPVFVDIGRETLNIVPEDLERKITQKSRVVLVQHTFGLPAKLDEIQEICQRQGLILIEDCAHSLGAKYTLEQGGYPAPSKEEAGSSTFRPRFASGKVGTFGKAAFFSFGRDKIISSVYGGMAVTDDPVLAEKIKEFQRNCPYPSRYWIFQQLLHPILTKYLIMPFYGFFGLGRWLLLFFQKLKVLSKAVHKKEKRGKKPGYFPQKMAEALAILALNQLKKLARFNSHCQSIATLYDKHLQTTNYQLPTTRIGRIYMRYSILIKNQDTDKILKKARQQKIFLDDGWRKTPIVPPDTIQEKMQYVPGTCPQAEKVAKEITNLPTHINICLKDAQKIVDFLRKY